MANSEFFLHKKSSFFSFFVYMRSIIISVLLTTAIKTSAQINIICPRLTDSTLNYFYIGVDNPIEIVGIKMTSNHKISIAGGYSSIMSLGGNNYFVRTTAVTDSCLITIYEGRKEIFRKRFNTREIANQVATLAGLRDTSISKNFILLNPFLSVIFPSCYFRSNFHVTSFGATFINSLDSLKTITSGYYLSQEQIKLIKETETGSKILFENIRATGPDDRTRALSSFWIKIQ